MLAAMARTADIGAETQAGGTTPRSKFWRMLPWAAPLTAAAAAAALYVAVRPDAVRSPEADRFRTPAVARSEVPAEPAAVAEKPSQETTRADSAAGPSRDEKAADVATRSRADSAAAAVEPRAGRADVDATRDKEEKRQLLASNAKAQEQVAQTPPPPPLPEAKDLQRELLDAPKPAAPPPPPQSLPPVTEQLRVVPQASARSASTAKPVASAYGQGGALAETVTITTAPALIPTPDARIRWRIVDGRVVQLSRDGGRTWTTQDTGASATLTAGAAPSAGVCWIVGAAGTVLRTTDRRTWARIEFPERTDLASVLATSADTATVTTTDGRTFTTSDGGKTWTRKNPHPSPF